MKAIEIRVTFNEIEAFQYARFLQRVTLSDYRERAMNDNEAYTMSHAGELIRDALKSKGFAPR